MNTRELILHSALKLFNEKGFEQVTLRDVAADLNKSYGNITYHFPGKESLITEHYRAMTAETAALLSGAGQEGGLLQTLLRAPSHTYGISVLYLYLFRDYPGLIRHFPALGRRVRRDNRERMKRYIHLLHRLQQEGYLRAELDDSDLYYLMELSGAVRTFFFLETPAAELKKKKTALIYCDKVNRLLLPYLSAKGRKVYLSVDQSQKI